MSAVRLDEEKTTATRAREVSNRVVLDSLGADRPAAQAQGLSTATSASNSAPYQHRYDLSFNPFTYPHHPYHHAVPSRWSAAAAALADAEAEEAQAIPRHDCPPSYGPFPYTFAQSTPSVVAPLASPPASHPAADPNTLRAFQFPDTYTAPRLLSVVPIYSSPPFPQCQRTVSLEPPENGF
jgi:hypothetical protein